MTGGSGTAPRLSRARAGIGPPRTTRLVHHGPGAFFRAHPAWYTSQAAGDWGIAAVTQRSDTMVDRLGDQDGVYTVLTRGPEGDTTEVVSSVSEVVGRTNPRGIELLADPDVVVVTLTVTEAGYRQGAPSLGRLVAGLDARRRADAGPISLLSCDNLAGNGAVLRRRLLETAGTEPAASDGLVEWIEETCAFPSCVVDRITPAAAPEDLETVRRLTGFDDHAAVVTEPFREWVIEDDFAAGRPGWETAGARLVTDVAPFEQRKLRFLNAGHSLLAYEGGQLGYRYVHEAVADPELLTALHQLWAEARVNLAPAALGGIDHYCADVQRRWQNARLPHALVQIGTDGSLKLRERIVPIIVAARTAGGEPLAAAGLLGAWIAHLRGHGGMEVRDARAAELAAAVAGDLPGAVTNVLDVLDEQLPPDGWTVGAVLDAARRWESRQRS